MPPTDTKNWKRICIFRKTAIWRPFWSTRLKRMSGLPAVGKFDDFSIQNTSPFIVQETHYDPWGLELTGLGFQAGGGVKVNRYLYNGKEIQNDHNLGMYDYGARFYDPVIGRWNVVDPLADEMRRHSPYNYAFNNSMRFIDPDGMAPGFPIKFTMSVTTGSVSMY